MQVLVDARCRVLLVVALAGTANAFGFMGHSALVGRGAATLDTLRRPLVSQLCPNRVRPSRAWGATQATMMLWGKCADPHALSPAPHPTQRPLIAMTLANLAADPSLTIVCTPSIYERIHVHSGFLPPPKGKGPDEPESTVVEVNNETEFETMLFSGTMTNKLVVVDWYASWCRVCFFLEPRFRKLAREFADKATFVKIDAIVLEYNDGKAGPSNLKSACGVTKYPTFQVWKQGTLVCEVVGAEDFKPKDFEKSLRALLQEWEERPAQPLRVAGVGKTKEAYKQLRSGGGGSNGGWRGGGGGDSSRTLGE